MKRAWILVAGIVYAVPLGVFVAGGLDALPCQTTAHPRESADEAVEILRVIDGDTILVDRDGYEDRVRILGIDSPEVARDGLPGERCADEATALTEMLTADADVVIVTDPSQLEPDPYGRTLAYVEADGQDVSGALLSAGLVEVYESAPEIARDADYEELAAEAELPDRER
ncbi:thermonuclease family protein [Brevibacterium yomogidense]|uniref:thermonuclease family protein n=1 Tax=Brevibacterium yomogidense TaxID=946573 RepID=UPI000B357F20|nr:thermonuclease family protein [Brevibacterium yomogidense]